MGFDKSLVKTVLNMIDRSEYKRQQLPPVLKIAGKAFGLGRRMPVAQGFRHK
jgi:NH3-dependent NAD+ synthetase